MDAIAWVLGLYIAFFLAGQYILVQRGRAMEGRPAPDLTAVLNPRQQRHHTLLLYFWNPACTLCHAVSAVLEPLMEERDDIIKIDINEKPDLTHAFGVLGTPTLVKVHEGRIQRVLAGCRSEAHIRVLLD